jgi:hypothetical protein
MIEFSSFRSGELGDVHGAVRSGPSFVLPTAFHLSLEHHNRGDDPRLSHCSVISTETYVTRYVTRTDKKNPPRTGN